MHFHGCVPAIKLRSAELQRSCRSADIPFDTTREATPSHDGARFMVGQQRATEALGFGIGIRRPGYNIFAVGPPGVGKQALVMEVVAAHAANAPRPSDWCYVHDFANPERPRALELPPGMGLRFQHDMEQAVTELRVAMRSTFESDEYRGRRQQLMVRFKERQKRALHAIKERAREREVAVVETDTGVAVAPIDQGVTLDVETFHALPQQRQDELKGQIDRVGTELQSLLHTFHDWANEHHQQVTELDYEMAAAAARHVLDGVRSGYANLPAVLEHLSHMERDVAESADQFLEDGGDGPESMLQLALGGDHADGPAFRRYQVNVLVDRSDQQGAPVIYEDNPTYTNLLGRIEHETQFGALITNFTLIRAGALHRAIGGYLIVDARRVLQHPFAWDALKRTIRAGELEIESPGQALSLVSTVTLEPTPIPLGQTKIVLLGERFLYYVLAALDPDFLELFKVLVDFEERTDRHPQSQRAYAELVASLVSQEQLRPFDRSAVARVIDHAARCAGDAEKLSVQLRAVTDLLHETDYWAGQEQRDVATAADVQHAIDAQLRRSDRVQKRLLEAIRRDDLLVSTSGDSTGQVNGLSVVSIGQQRFGHPTRITARVRLGKGEVIDIDREVELGGPIHSKGVLILNGFLGSRYATRFPLSLSASLVFEQSYAAVEGDSASLAELCALLSALADVPVRQSLAMTGSVNQQGQVQSIGGVNEKIEGFFDVCAERGLTGEQGVLIPRSNVKNLMLRQDVVDAVDAGRFGVYAVADVDDAIELLTGRPAGVRDGDRVFPDGSINALVEARLASFAERARSFLARPQPERGHDSP